MSTRDLDRLHEERVDAAMKLWGSDDRLIAPEDLFVSERVIKTVRSDKVFLPSYNRQKILASIPFAPNTYVVLCPGCIRPNNFNFDDFRKFAKSGLIIPVLLGRYESYPERLVELLLSVDHVSTYEYQAYRSAKLIEMTTRQICQHCANEKIEAMTAVVRRRRNSSEFRWSIDRINENISPFVYPDYTLLDQALAACECRDLDQLNQLSQLAETIHNIRSAQALSAPISVDDDALAEIPVGVSNESDEGLRLLSQMRKFASDGLGLTFPADMPLDRYLELAKDYQPTISSLIEYTGVATSIEELSKRIGSLNSEIERIQGLKRYVMLEASMVLVRNHRGMVFATILAGAFGLAGGGWLGCGATVSATGALKLAKKLGLF